MKRFVTYNTEDAEAGKIPVDSNGTMTGEGIYDAVLNMDSPATGGTVTFIQGDYASLFDKLINGELVTVMCKMYRAGSLSFYDVLSPVHVSACVGGNSIDMRFVFGDSILVVYFDGSAGGTAGSVTRNKVSVTPSV